ncbi:MAG: molybdopterin-dependent oxidoreductase [Gemmobacter sp.]|nr:molybdopterin-dependent oxidoreductase [Gemmobacter sp.]
MAGVPFSPVTHYVKNSFAGGGGFSYATNPIDYDTAAARQAADLDQWLNAQSDLTFQPLVCDMQAMDPMFMEPEAGLAWADGASGTLNLVLGTQSPDGDIRDVLSMYDDPGAPFKVTAVNLTSCYPGGGFGGRDSSPFSLLLALAAAFTNGAPVRLALNRFQQFQTGLKRHPCAIKGRLAVGPDMGIVAVQAGLEFDGGGRKNLSPYVASLAALCMGGAYAVPRADVHAQAVQSANAPGGSQRGFGGPQAFFALETALDDVALHNGWDPLALRRRNLAQPDDTTVVGGPFGQSLRLGEMLDVIAAHPLWADRAAIKAAHAQAGRVYGTGIALSMEAYGTGGDGVIASVRLEQDGSLSVRSDAVDMGNGSATTLGVVIGPILGANAGRVAMGDYTLFGQSGLVTGTTLPDGQKGGWDVPMWTAKGVGSSSACLTGLHQVHVVQETARALMALCVRPAAARLWAIAQPSADSVVWDAGTLRLRVGSRPGLSLAEIAAEAYQASLPVATLGHAFFQGDWLRADFPVGPGGAQATLSLDGLALFFDGGAAQPLARRNPQPPPAQAARWSRFVWAPSANIVGLLVDPDTGLVRVENVVSVLNAGRVHVPQLVSGQSQGGVAMAISYALLEDMPPGMAGPADGTWNLNRYHVARLADVPLATTYFPGGRAQELIVLPEVPMDAGAGRGIAEAVMCAIAPAISNALRDATGRRFSSLPMTPDKILKGLRA